MLERREQPFAAMQVPALTAAERLSVEEWLEWLEAVLVPGVQAALVRMAVAVLAIMVNQV